MIRIALLGCGRIARIHHLPSLAKLADARVSALADPDEATRRRAEVALPEARPLADWRAAIDDSAVDAVVVCLPSGLHAEAAGAAFEAGKHVYLEKPIATRASAAAVVVAAWRRSGTVGMIGFNQRFHPAVAAARDAIRGGAIGAPIGARMVSGSPPRELPSWKRDRASGGGALLDALSHHADLARFLFDDEVREVAASVRSVRSEDDNAWTTLTMAGGARVESRVSFTSPQENRFQVTGEKGIVAVDRIEGSFELETGGPRWDRRQRLAAEGRRLAKGLRRALRPPHDPSYRLALETFVRAAHSGGHPAPDIEDGARSLAVVLAAEESAREGRRVAVPPLPGP